MGKSISRAIKRGPNGAPPGPDKGTNVGATAAALQGFAEPVVLIAGGDIEQGGVLKAPFGVLAKRATTAEADIAIAE